MPSFQYNQDMAEKKIQTIDYTKLRDIPLIILLWTGVAIILLYLVQKIIEVIIVLVISVALAYVLNPLVTFFEKKMPRFLAILFTYLIVLIGIGLIFYFIINVIITQFLLFISFLQQTLGHKSLSDIITIPNQFSFLKSLGLTSQINGISGQILGQLQNIANSIIPFISNVVSALLDFILIVVLSIYLLMDGGKIITWIYANLPKRFHKDVAFVIDTFSYIIGGYIRGQLLLSALIGALVGIGMTILHVPFSALLGLIAFLFEFVPVLGTITSGVICTLFALSNGILSAVAVLLYFVGVHIIEGDVIGPRIVGKAIGIHPAVSLFAVIVGTRLFGITGALFAAPIAGLIQVFLKLLWVKGKEYFF